MAHRTPRDLLSNLPEELKSRIYTFYFSDKYLVYGDPFWLAWESDGSDPTAPIQLSKTLADVSLLLVCKVIRVGALEHCMKHCVFKFAVDPPITDSSEEDIPKEAVPPPVPSDLIRRMRNVVIVFNAAPWSICRSTLLLPNREALEAMSAASIELFTGTEVRRPLLRVVFSGLSGWCTGFIIYTSFFTALSSIYAFDKLLIQGEAFPERRARSPTELAEDYQNVRKFLAQASEALIPELGKCSEGNTVSAHKPNNSPWLEFEPREHRIKVLQEEIGRLNADYCPFETR